MSVSLKPISQQVAPIQPTAVDTPFPPRDPEGTLCEAGESGHIRGTTARATAAE